jgi:hypothetical protein
VRICTAATAKERVDHPGLSEHLQRHLCLLQDVWVHEVRRLLALFDHVVDTAQLDLRCGWVWSQLLAHLSC